jgi:hypothetical protein
MSNGFAGSTTRTMGNFERELEKRTKKLDVFTDEFSPPGATDAEPGRNYTKGKEYQKPHDDPTPKTDLPSKGRALAAGKASDQPPLDKMDEEEQKRTGGIKPPDEQFPSGRTFKNRLQRLKFEIKKDIGLSEDYICSQCDIGAHERCRGGDCECHCRKGK